MELYKKFRPKTLKAVLGQPGPVASLQRFVANNNVPHAMLFTGPSGCGKTTLARILVRELGCSKADFQELNCADFKGIDMVRDLRRSAGLAPMEGPCRVWLIDEAHELTGPAQQAFLKLLEDTPGHVYFMLATTDPGKLRKTIHTRCTEIRLSSMSNVAMLRLLDRVCERAGITTGPAVKDAIMEAAEGSARKALVLLEQAGFLDGEEAQLQAVQASQESKTQAIELARALLGGAGWPAVAKLLKEITEDPESLRHMVLGYCAAVLLGGGRMSGRAFHIIDVFGSNFYDSKRPGLIAACYEVATAGK